MTKRYTVLQKKLQELESALHQVFTLNSETPCNTLLYEGVEQRFAFLNNLLSAEIASHPTKPQHLHHMNDRLTELETLFHDWYYFKTTKNSPSKFEVVEQFETASNCSCTESCLNDDGGGDDDDCGEFGLQECEDPEVFLFDDEVVKEKAEVLREMEAEKTEKERGSSSWGGGSMASGVMIGMALMGFLMVNFAGCFDHMERDFIVTPT